MWYFQTETNNKFVKMFDLTEIKQQNKHAAVVRFCTEIYR